MEHGMDSDMSSSPNHEVSKGQTNNFFVFELLDISMTMNHFSVAAQVRAAQVRGRAQILCGDLCDKRSTSFSLPSNQA